ncbi:hypothetical protein PENCOP_c015G03571 [Penicillium coprophilum]|uniref:Uncharacterized protein n=1 Tax=Penicillium coprophilum TaxID=36646 RepID=A0A1V6U8U2_9EURO|nr:hypothetical protein PENCOP_c015G03571 [Penicillium coprophilum]
MSRNDGSTRSVARANRAPITAITASAGAVIKTEAAALEAVH